MQYRIDIRLVAAAVLASSILLGGCGGGGGNDTVNGVKFKVNTPAEIAQTSADDYNNNVNGVITGATLKRWMDDWGNNRPTGITGKLVILQAAKGETGFEHIKPNGNNVFSYLESTWGMTRNNGVIETVSMVLDGSTIDSYLKKYDINPDKDMIVCAQGTGSTSNAMGMGRCWYNLRYWGIDKNHLALLNGGNKWQANGGGLDAGYFVGTAGTPPNNGTASVMNLAVDNSALQATLQDMLNVLPSNDANVLNDGVFIWDAREVGQYSAGEWLEGGDCSGSIYCAAASGYDYMKKFQNGGSRQGHPWGAAQLNFTNLLDAGKGYSYKPKSELQAYMNGFGDNKGYGFVGSNYQVLGQGAAYQPNDTVYTYCETTYRAMVTGVATAVILGLPTRFYDGAMVEWNSLSNIQDKNGNFILPADSPWRTDTRSFYRAASSPSLINTRNVINPYASSANAIVNADKGYKTGETVSTGGGGLPGNPCGG